MSAIFVSCVPKGLKYGPVSRIIKEGIETVAQVKKIWVHPNKGYAVVELYCESSIDVVLTLDKKIEVNKTQLHLERFLTNIRKSGRQQVTKNHVGYISCGDDQTHDPSSSSGFIGYRTYTEYKNHRSEIERGQTQVGFTLKKKKKKKTWKNIQNQHFITAPRPRLVRKAYIPFEHKRKRNVHQIMVQHSFDRPRIEHRDLARNRVINGFSVKNEQKKEFIPTACNRDLLKHRKDCENSSNKTDRCLSFQQSLSLPHAENNGVRAHVYHSSKYLFDIDVDNNCVFESIREAVCQKYQVRPESFLLFFNGKLLNKTYQPIISNDENIHVTIKGVGGMEKDNFPKNMRRLTTALSAKAREKRTNYSKDNRYSFGRNEPVRGELSRDRRSTTIGAADIVANYSEEDRYSFLGNTPLPDEQSRRRSTTMGEPVIGANYSEDDRYSLRGNTPLPDEQSRRRSTTMGVPDLGANFSEDDGYSFLSNTPLHEEQTRGRRSTTMGPPDRRPNYFEDMGDSSLSYTSQSLGRPHLTPRFTTGDRRSTTMPYEEWFPPEKYFTTKPEHVTEHTVPETRPNTSVSHIKRPATMSSDTSSSGTTDGSPRSTPKSENRQTDKTYSPDSKDDIRIVLIGKTGAGKSATGNTILGTDAFKSLLSGESVTHKCQSDKARRFGKNILVVDTPGIYDTGVNIEQTKEEVSRLVGMSVPGPHAIILVLSLGRFTKEEQDAVKQLADLFGDDMYEYLIVLFTRRDELERQSESLETFLKRGKKEVRDLLDMCNHQQIAFDNTNSTEKRDIDAKHLIDLIEKIVKRNGGTYYTNEMYERAVELFKKRELERKRKIEDQRRRYEEQIRRDVSSKYETITQKMEERNWVLRRQLEESADANKNAISDLYDQMEVNKRENRIREESIKQERDSLSSQLRAAQDQLANSKDTGKEEQNKLIAEIKNINEKLANKEAEKNDQKEIFDEQRKSLKDELDSMKQSQEELKKQMEKQAADMKTQAHEMEKQKQQHLMDKMKKQYEDKLKIANDVLKEKEQNYSELKDEIDEIKKNQETTCLLS